ncbi:MAG: hypothetical protein ACREOP_01515 [Thermodesulfobacteriota bacterium]
MTEERIVLFEDYAYENPEEFRHWRNSNLTKSLVNSLLAEVHHAQVQLLRAEVITPDQVAGRNYNQGVMIAIETILNKLNTDPFADRPGDLPPTEEPDTAFS